jgi:hypothetical protein
MSAVPVPLMIVPRAWMPASDGVAWPVSGFARQVLAGLGSARTSSLVEDLDEAVTFHSTEAARLEALILRCCFRQIAAAAGPGACVVGVGEAAGPNAALLRNATTPVPHPMQCDRSRQLLVLPPDSMRACSPDEVVRTLYRIGESHAGDPLLVVGAALPPFRGRFAASDSIDGSTSYRYSVPRFESLAESAGWQRCQLWSDAQARYAVHVLERNTHVTET